MEFSGKVKIARKKVHFSQEDMVRQLGISFATVNRWESGKNSPSRLALKAFEDFCKDYSVVWDCAEPSAKYENV